MEKGTIFQFTAPNGAEVTAVVLNVTTRIDDCSDRLFCHHICYGQNRVFDYFITYNQVPVAVDRDEFGDDIIENQTVIEDSAFGEVLVDYCIIPGADDALEKYTTEQNTLNRRMILLETTSGISVEQEIAICEAIGKTISPSEKHVHVMFDRHFADKELCDKYNLVYPTIDE